ncbi:MAG: hypothetical protein WBD64_04160 [Candidatus Zixiibacteriota bacterium]
MAKKAGDAGARGIDEMVQGEVEKKSPKLLRKWSLSPIVTGPKRKGGDKVKQVWGEVSKARR